MTSLRPRSVVWSLDHADFALIFKLVRVLIGHVIVRLRVWYHLIVVLVLLYWLLLGILRLRISVDHAWVSYLVWRVLRWVDLLAVSLVWVPVDVWIIRTVVVAMRGMLEWVNNILLVRCSHIRLCWIVWEVAHAMAVLLSSFRLHEVILSHIKGSHGVFALVKYLVWIEMLSHTLIFSCTLPIHVGMWLYWVIYMSHHLLVLQTPWILFHAWSNFSYLSLLATWIGFLNRWRSCYFLCNHSTRAARLCSNTWFSRGRIYLLKWAIKVSATLQIGLGEYHVIVSRFDAALMLLFLCGCWTLLGSH